MQGWGRRWSLSNNRHAWPRGCLRIRVEAGKIRRTMASRGPSIYCLETIAVLDSQNSPMNTTTLTNELFVPVPILLRTKEEVVEQRRKNVDREYQEIAEGRP